MALAEGHEEQARLGGASHVDRIQLGRVNPSRWLKAPGIKLDQGVVSFRLQPFRFPHAVTLESSLARVGAIEYTASIAMGPFTTSRRTCQ